MNQFCQMYKHRVKGWITMLVVYNRLTCSVLGNFLLFCDLFFFFFLTPPSLPSKSLDPEAVYFWVEVYSLVLGIVHRSCCSKQGKTHPRPPGQDDDKGRALSGEEGD